MPNTSKMGFTTQHYTMKPPHTVSNYDPDNNVIKQEAPQGAQGTAATTATAAKY